MIKPKIILVGAGGHCRSCIDVVEQEGRFEIVGIVDKAEHGAPSSLLGYPLIGNDDDLPALANQYGQALVTVGQIMSAVVRVRLFGVLKEFGFTFPTIISPQAYVSPYATIGEGTIAMHRALVNANAVVGTNCILNTGCLVEHDAIVGNQVHVSTGAVINGSSKVGDYSFIGSGATVINSITLPDRSFVRAGQLVVSDKDYRVQEGES